MIRETVEHENEIKRKDFWNLEPWREILSAINKVDKIRISCECVGGSILEANFNMFYIYCDYHTGFHFDSVKDIKHQRFLSDDVSL